MLYRGALGYFGGDRSTESSHDNLDYKTNGCLLRCAVAVPDPAPPRDECFDSYVLSESSLFVYKSKLVLKTCGRITLSGQSHLTPLSFCAV